MHINPSELRLGQDNFLFHTQDKTMHRDKDRLGLQQAALSQAQIRKIDRALYKPGSFSRCHRPASPRGELQKSPWAPVWAALFPLQR